jgi:hypothetical protein
MVFKAPSEHTFEGKHTDLEIQFYHSTPEGFNENFWDGRRLDGLLMGTSIFFDRLHGGNEDNQFIESLELDSENRSCQEALGLPEETQPDGTSNYQDPGGWCLPNLDI